MKTHDKMTIYTNVIQYRVVNTLIIRDLFFDYLLCTYEILSFPFYTFSSIY